MPTTIKRKAVLRSKASCVTCRTRRKKCDLTKPICSECARLQLSCEWLADDNKSIAKAVQEGLLVRKNRVVPLDSVVSQRDRFEDPVVRYSKEVAALNLPRETTFTVEFDHPCIIRCSPTSVLGSYEEKHVYQFLKEKGHGFFKLPLAKVAPVQNLNIFSVAFGMAVTQKGLLNAHLALAAAQLSHQHPQFSKLVPIFYSKAIQFIKAEFDTGDEDFPSEAVCGVAGTLSLLEMCMFTDGKARVAHLLGYHHLMQLKLQKAPESFSRIKLLPELYSQMLATSATFYPNELIGDKSYEYFDSILAFMNDTPRPLGPEIMGTAPAMLGACWKLACLRSNVISGERYTKELTDLLEVLYAWEPEPRLFHPVNRDKLFIAQLYHLACSIFAEKLAAPETDNRAPIFQKHVQKVLNLTEEYPQKLSPMINQAWPAIIISLAAINRKDFDLLRRPLYGLVYQCGFKAFMSAIQFTDNAWGEGPGGKGFMGLDALFDDSMLRHVHI